MEEEIPSQFYFACRNDDIEVVRLLLEQHSLEDLDKIEPNGSTALHAACFYSRINIVKLLLDRGFTRRIVNKHGSTPFYESKTEEIRQLFTRPKTSNRFGIDVPYEIEKLIWIVIDGNEQSVTLNYAPDIYRGNRLEYGIFHGDLIIQQLGNDMPKIDVIRRLFRRAIDEKDCTRLVQAFTAETEFYDRVNQYLLTKNQENTRQSSTVQSHMSEFIDTIVFNRQLHEKYHFQGVCYRSLKIRSDQDLSMYKIGTKLVNRTFISATKDREFAENNVRDRNEEKKYAAIISFEIRQCKTALKIQYLSEFPDENEILIMHSKIFKVISVKMKNSFDVEIELRESNSTRVDQKVKQNSLSLPLHLT